MCALRHRLTDNRYTKRRRIRFGARTSTTVAGWTLTDFAGRSSSSSRVEERAALASSRPSCGDCDCFARRSNSRIRSASILGIAQSINYAVMALSPTSIFINLLLFFSLTFSGQRYSCPSSFFHVTLAPLRPDDDDDDADALDFFFDVVSNTMANCPSAVTDCVCIAHC